MFRKRSNTDKDAGPKFPELKEADIDVDEFYVPARDLEGDKVRIYAWIQPAHARQIEIYCKSDKLPYGTGPDLIRHAIWRHLHWLKTLPVPIRSIMAQADLIQEHTKDEEYQLKFEETFLRTSTVVSKHVSANNIDQARKYLLLAANSIQAMAPGSWKERYKSEFRQRYGPYFTAVSIPKQIAEAMEPEED